VVSATTDVTVSRRTVSGRLEVSAGYGAMVLIGLYEETDEDSAAVLRHAIDTGVTSSLPRTPKDPTASPSGWSGGPSQAVLYGATASPGSGTCPVGAVGSGKRGQRAASRTPTTPARAASTAARYRGAVRNAATVSPQTTTAG